MQNIDFSRKIQRSSPFEKARQPAGTPTVQAQTGELKSRNRSIVLVLALLICTFTGGLMAGIQLGQLRQMDENLVRYPDKAPAEAATFSNTSAPQANPTEGRYLIKVGVFPEQSAGLLTTRLNNVPEIARTKPVKCKNVRESVAGRYAAFRVAREGDSQDVFIGCFFSLDKARDILDAARASGIPGISSAKLYEID